MGDESDVDMTAMALTSLAPYQEETDIKAAVDAPLTYLSDAQQADGGFMSWGAANSESCAQVIVALTALGIDSAADSRFVKTARPRWTACAPLPARAAASVTAMRYGYRAGLLRTGRLRPLPAGPDTPVRHDGY